MRPLCVEGVGEMCKQRFESFLGALSSLMPKFLVHKKATSVAFLDIFLPFFLNSDG